MADSGVISNDDGTFTLVLNNLKMGSRLGDVRVTKADMMIFNQHAVDEWTVRKEPLCLILCDADEYQKQKQKLIAIGESQINKKYDSKLAELKKQNEDKQLKIDEYYNKLDSLEKEYQNALKHMDEYADVFVRIDESEVDTLAQRAIELFHRGEIEESLRLLGQGNTLRKADGLIQSAEMLIRMADKAKKEYIDAIKCQISVYKLREEWDKAKSLFKELADIIEDVDRHEVKIDTTAVSRDELAQEYALKFVHQAKERLGADSTLVHFAFTPEEFLKALSDIKQCEKQFSIT